MHLLQHAVLLGSNASPCRHMFKSIIDCNVVMCKADCTARRTRQGVNAVYLVGTVTTDHS